MIAPADEAFLTDEGLDKGGDDPDRRGRARTRSTRAWREAVKTSGGSAANTVAGVASFGGRSAFIGKVGADALGEVYARDMRGDRRRLRTPRR